MQCWLWRAVAGLLELLTQTHAGHSCLPSISHMVTQKKDVTKYGYVHHDTDEETDDDDTDDDYTAQDFLETGSEVDTDEEEEYDDRIEDHNV